MELQHGRQVKAADLAVNTALRQRVLETQRLQDRLAEQIERTQSDIEQVEVLARRQTADGKAERETRNEP